MDKKKKRICAEVDAITDVLFSISDFLKENPETAYLEKKACQFFFLVHRDSLSAVPVH